MLQFLLPLLAGGAAGAASLLSQQKSAKKKNTEYGGQRIKPISEMPSYKSTRDMLAGYGSPEDYVNKYYDYAYQPSADMARYNWQTYTKPEFLDNQAAMGFQNSDRALKLLNTSMNENEMSLAQLAANLKTQGLERGYGKETEKLNAYENLLAQERANQQAMADFDMQDYSNQMNISNAQRQAQSQLLPNALTTAGNVAAGLGNYGTSYELMKYLTSKNPSDSNSSNVGFSFPDIPSVASAIQDPNSYANTMNTPTKYKRITPSKSKYKYIPDYMSGWGDDNG